MGIRNTEHDPAVALYDSVSGQAFGLVMESGDEAEAFLRFAEREADSDLRTVDDATLSDLHARFRAEEWETE